MLHTFQCRLWRDANPEDGQKSRPGLIDRIVFLGRAPNEPAHELKSQSLFIVARDDKNAAGPRLPRIREQFEAAPQPKKLIVVDGSAHAQFLFQANQTSAT